MTWTTTIEKSGRIKLPDEFLERRGIKPGQKVRIIPEKNGWYRLEFEVEDIRNSREDEVRTEN